MRIDLSLEDETNFVEIPDDMDFEEGIEYIAAAEEKLLHNSKQEPVKPSNDAD